MHLQHAEWVRWVRNHALYQKEQNLLSKTNAEPWCRPAGLLGPLNQCQEEHCWMSIFWPPFIFGCLLASFRVCKHLSFSIAVLLCRLSSCFWEKSLWLDFFFSLRLIARFLPSSCLISVFYYLLVMFFISCYSFPFPLPTTLFISQFSSSSLIHILLSPLTFSLPCLLTCWHSKSFCLDLPDLFALANPYFTCLVASPWPISPFVDVCSPSVFPPSCRL